MSKDSLVEKLLPTPSTPAAQLHCQAVDRSMESEVLLADMIYLAGGNVKKCSTERLVSKVEAAARP